MSKVLITGGAGFIGSEVARALIRRGVEVQILDNFSSQVHTVAQLPRDLVDLVRLFKADIRDRSSLTKALMGVDSVVHLAAETGTGQSMYEIDRYFSVNVQGTAILLELLQNSDAGKAVRSIVVASSRAVYGEGAYCCELHGIQYPEARSRLSMAAGMFDPRCPKCMSLLTVLPTHESAPFMPASMYGLTKQVQEQAVLLFANNRGINGIALRFQNVFGPGQSLVNPYTGILSIFTNLARGRKPIEVFEDGMESRDFVYIDDVVEATVRSVFLDRPFVGPVNVGSGVGTNVLTVANGIADYFGFDGGVSVNGAFRVGDIRHNVADVTRLHEVLGITPRMSFGEGLIRFLRWAETCGVDGDAGYRRSIEELRSRGLMG